MATTLDVTITTRHSRHEVIDAVHRAVERLTTGAGSPSVNRLKVRTGLTVLQLVHKAFQVKSRGQTDQAGLRWAPLSPVTIRRRRYRGDRRRDPLILQETRELAGTLKPGGNPNSSRRSSPPRREGQVFRLTEGGLDVGTTNWKGLLHHAGNPPKLPQRRLWAPPQDWPDSWWQAILAVVHDELVRLILEELA